YSSHLLMGEQVGGGRSRWTLRVMQATGNVETLTKQMELGQNVRTRSLTNARTDTGHSENGIKLPRTRTGHRPDAKERVVRPSPHPARHTDRELRRAAAARSKRTRRG